MAYSKSVPAFLVQYGANSSKLKSAVAQLSKLLLMNSVAENKDAVTSQPTQKDLVNHVLKGKWGLLSSKLKIAQPSDMRVQAAWDLLSSQFAPGGAPRNIGEVFDALLNVPYGYDSNTLTLLFCSWFGCNSQDLQLSLGKRYDISEFHKHLEAGKPKDFVSARAKLELARKDLNQVSQEVQDIIGRVCRKEILSPEDADSFLQKLDGFIQDGRNPANIIQQAHEVQDALRQARGAQEQYDKKALVFHESVKAAETVLELLKQRHALKELPDTGFVQIQQPSLSKLQEYVLNKIVKELEPTCTDLSKLKSLDNFAIQEKQLSALVSSLETNSLPAPAARARQAMEALKNARIALRQEQAEKQLRDRCAMIANSGTLAQLRTGIEEAGKIQNPSEQLAALQAKMAKRRDALIELLSAAEEELPCVLSYSQLVPLRDRLQEYRHKFDGSEEAKKLEVAITRCKKLEAFFLEIENAKPDQVKDEGDVKSLSEQILALLTEFGPDLSPAQGQLGKSLAQKIRDIVTLKQGEALKWVEERENQLNESQCDVLGLQRELSQPPPFMAKEARERIAALRLKAQERLDRDEVEAIVAHFKAISDPAKRAECLRRLQELVE